MPKPPVVSPYQQLVNKWKNCTKCDLCKRRCQVVMYRGAIPCDVLFVGEAPGESEDVIGRPFIGPAGDLLNRQIEAALKDSGLTEVKLGFVNLVGCIPKDEERKKQEPTKKEIEACHPRLEALFKLAKPTAVVAVGKLSEQRLGSAFGTAHAHTFISITHPAAILRADKSQQGLAIQRVIVQLAEVFESLIPF